MEKVYVKLRDKGSIIHDASQNVVIVGRKPFLVVKTTQIARAIGSKVLTLLTEEEGKAELAAYEAEKNAILGIVVEEAIVLEPITELVAPENTDLEPAALALEPVLEPITEITEELTVISIEKPDYMMQTNDELLAQLKVRGIEVAGGKKKAELAALLAMDDENK